MVECAAGDGDSLGQADEAAACPDVIVRAGRRCLGCAVGSIDHADLENRTRLAGDRDRDQIG
jgi:hypothetical protein